MLQIVNEARVPILFQENIRQVAINRFEYISL